MMTVYVLKTLLLSSNYLRNLLFAVNWVKFQVKIKDHIKDIILRDL